MIELATELLEKNIKFTEGKVNVLEINNKALYREIIYRLNKKISIDDEFEDIYLYENEKEIPVYKNIILINDIFNIFSNQTKILKKFYDDIAKEYKFNYNEEEIIKLQKKLIQSVRDILMEYDYELTLKETMDIKDILKILDVKFDLDYYDNPLESLFLLIDLILNFNICKVLILVNVKCFFSQKEFEELAKLMVYKKINVLFIEYYKSDNNTIYETKVLIDEDFDEFYIK